MSSTQNINYDVTSYIAIDNKSSNLSNEALNNINQISKDSLKNTSNISKTFDIITNTLETNKLKKIYIGKCGIKNLGNTCYMNSALQSIVHSKEIANLFANYSTGNYSNSLDSIQKIKDISTFDIENINLKKELFYLFVEFVKDVWNPERINNNYINSKNNNTYPVIDLSKFRKIFTSIYNDFNNNLQHDSHEFITYLLDSLHQSLNRVENYKNVISEEFQESQILLSKTLSNAYYSNHKKFNDSYITDLFNGQLKSCTTCINCKEQFITYDPFSSIELPILNEYKILIYVIRSNNINYRIFVNIHEQMQYIDLRYEIENILDIKLYKNLIFYFVINNRLKEIKKQLDKLGNLSDRDSFLFVIEDKIKLINDNDNKVTTKISINKENYLNLNNNNKNSKFKLCTDNLKDNAYCVINMGLIKQINKNNNASETLHTPDIIPNNSIQNISFPRIYTRHVDTTINNLLLSINSIGKLYYNNNNSNIFNQQFSIYIGSTLFKKNLNKNSNNSNLCINDKIEKSTENTVDSFNKYFICLICKKAKDYYFYCNCLNELNLNKININTLGDIFNLNEINLDCSLDQVDKHKNNKYSILNILYFNIIYKNKIAVEINSLNSCIDKLSITNKHKKYLTLNNLLNAYTSEEILNSYTCRQCNITGTAIRKLDINRFPQILVFQLKRFTFKNFSNNNNKSTNKKQYYEIKGEKNENLVYFFDSLSMDSYSVKNFSKLKSKNTDINKTFKDVNQKSVYNNNNTKLDYKLFSIINHCGKINSGHYTCLAKHHIDNKWYEFDDKTVQPYYKNIVSNKAYLLFYSK